MVIEYEKNNQPLETNPENSRTAYKRFGDKETPNEDVGDVNGS